MRYTCCLALLLGAACQARSFTVTVTGSGRPMILIPGLESSADVWDSVAAHYKSGYQVHALTLAGFAGLPPVEGLRLATVRDEIIRYIRDNRLDHPIIVGHSLGGFMALWIAVTAPDLPGAIVSVDGLPFLGAVFDPANAGQMRQMYAASNAVQMEAMARMALTRMITAPNDIEMAAKWAARSDPAFVGQAIYDLLTTDLRPEMAKLRAPLLLIGAGKSVPDLLEMQRTYEQQVAGAPIHRVIMDRDALHFIMLDDPQFLLGQMDAFLAAQGGRHVR